MYPASPRLPIATTALLIATLALTALPATSARAGTGRELASAGYFVLAGLQLPAVGFELASALKLKGQLDLYTGDEAFAGKATSAYRGNIAGAAIHGVKFVCWAVGGISIMGDTEFLPMLMVFANGLLDMGNAIMGVVLGASLLGSKRSAMVAGSPMGDAATLSGVVHIVFGSISAIVTLPELLVGLFGAIISAQAPWKDRDIRLAVGPGSVSLVGRW